MPVAQPHIHQHGHLHEKYAREALEKRAAVTVTAVVPAIETQYVLQDGSTLDVSKAEEGIEDGLYIVVGATTPSFTPPPPPVP